MAAALVPEAFGWVLLALVANILVSNVWMMFQVGAARKKYKVFYPAMYAVEGENKDAKIFNCVQRGHQNTLEFMPTFVSLLLMSGLHFPRVAAVFGFMYTLARIQYFRGYSTGNASSRYSGGARFQWLGLIGLLVCTITFALHLLLPQYV